MKKSFIIVLACSFFTVNATSAQTESNYGGQQGSFALTIDADPVINFVGNMFTGATDNYLNDFGTTIAGKYFVSDNFPFNVGLGINNMKTTEFFYDYDDEDMKKVQGKATEGVKSFSIELGAQYYLRPGKRLQPFVGANIFYGREVEGFVSLKSKSDDCEVDYDGDVLVDGYYKASAPLNIFGLSANVGVEYFLRQNISISAILNLGINTATMKAISKYDEEDVDKDDIDAMNYSYKLGKFTSLTTNGKIAFNFYF